MAGPAADPLPLPVLPSATLHSHRLWLPWNLINQTGRPLGPWESTGWAGPQGSGVEAPSARREETSQGNALIKCSRSSKRLKTGVGWGAQKRWLNYREEGSRGPELGPVGFRTGCGDQFDWQSLWVKVGLGRQAGARPAWQDGVSAGGLEQVGGVRQSPGQGGGSCPTAYGGLGGSWSLRHPSRQVSPNSLGLSPSSAFLPESPRC